MTEDEVYFPKDPIVEAAVGIEVEPLDAAKLSEIEKLTALLAVEYPSREDLLTANFSFALGAEPTKHERQVGYVFKSEDGRQVLQAHLGGLTFSRLAPYERWVPFATEARRVWTIFRSVLGDLKSRSYSVRFINKLPIPSGEEISHYLKTYPEVAAELPQMFTALYLRMDFPLPEGGLYTMQQTTVPSDNPELVAYILDNTFVYSGSFDEANLWAGINSVQKTKNDIFLGCITDRMKERLK